MEELGLAFAASLDALLRSHDEFLSRLDALVHRVHLTLRLGQRVSFKKLTAGSCSPRALMATSNLPTLARASAMNVSGSMGTRNHWPGVYAGTCDRCCAGDLLSAFGHFCAGGLFPRSNCNQPSRRRWKSILSADNCQRRTHDTKHCLDTRVNTMVDRGTVFHILRILHSTGHLVHCRQRRRLK